MHVEEEGREAGLHTEKALPGPGLRQELQVSNGSRVFRGGWQSLPAWGQKAEVQGSQPIR